MVQYIVEDEEEGMTEIGIIQQLGMKLPQQWKTIKLPQLLSIRKR